MSARAERALTSTASAAPVRRETGAALTSHDHAGAGNTRRVVGPNAILQMQGVLAERVGAARSLEIFERAGLARYIATPPDGMVAEAEAAQLFAAVMADQGPAAADELLREAGLRTGDYILANRIPAVAHRMLPLLPDWIAGRALLKAIAAHAWTFAGSGQAEIAMPLGRPLELAIHGNPLATPGCPWHLGVVERLFRRLVADGVRVEHVACCAAGDEACRTRIVL